MKKIRCFVSEKEKKAFVLLPKCANTTIHRIIKDNYPNFQIQTEKTIADFCHEGYKILLPVRVPYNKLKSAIINKFVQINLFNTTPSLSVHMYTVLYTEYILKGDLLNITIKDIFDFFCRTNHRMNAHFSSICENLFKSYKDNLDEKKILLKNIIIVKIDEQDLISAIGQFLGQIKLSDRKSNISNYKIVDKRLLNFLDSKYCIYFINQKFKEDFEIFNYNIKNINVIDATYESTDNIKLFSQEQNDRIVCLIEETMKKNTKTLDYLRSILGKT